MRARGSLADDELRSNLLVRFALGDQGQDLSFPLGQKVLRPRCCAAPQRCRELAGDGRVQMDLPALSRPDGRRDLICLCVLEQVTGTSSR